jgi:hypothetical protein
VPTAAAVAVLFVGFVAGPMPTLMMFMHNRSPYLHSTITSLHNDMKTARPRTGPDGRLPDGG